MKKILFALCLGLLVSCGDATVEQATLFDDQFGQGTPIKIEEIGLEVMSKDLCYTNWEEAQKECAELGSEWRLPRVDEFKKIWPFKDSIGGFSTSYYWCLNSPRRHNEKAFVFHFEEESVEHCGTYHYLKTSDASVRPVRSLK